MDLLKQGDEERYDARLSRRASPANLDHPIKNDGSLVILIHPGGANVQNEDLHNCNNKTPWTNNLLKSIRPDNSKRLQQARDTPEKIRLISILLFSPMCLVAIRFLLDTEHKTKLSRYYVFPNIRL